MHQLILNNFAMHIALAPDEQEQVLAFFQFKVVKKRAWLLHAGETHRYIYFVKRGCLRMFYADKSGEVLYLFATAGNTVPNHTEV